MASRISARDDRAIIKEDDMDVDRAGKQAQHGHAADAIRVLTAETAASHAGEGFICTVDYGVEPGPHD